MEQYYGDIELGKIENSGGNENKIELIAAKFSHYPDSQQLIIWLPQDGWNGYGAIRLIDTKTQRIVDERPVKDRLNGSIQILWDTLEIPPGEYRIEIEHPKRGKHFLSFTKYKAGAQTPIKAPIAEHNIPSEQVVYRDGFGKTLPNEDLILIEKLLNGLAVKASRRIEYEGNFRAGRINYVSGDIAIHFPHEMGGGGCKFYIEVPTENNWEAATKTPLVSRAEIIEFIAKTVQREQASSWRYEIKEEGIFYY